MRRILITGGSGFIGTNLVARYLAEGCSVLSLDREAPRDPGQAAHWKRIDLCDRESVLNAVTAFDPEYLFHLGARTDLDGAGVDAYVVNTGGTSNVIDALERLPRIKRVLFASTILVCRLGYMPKDETDYCPTTPYGESKQRMETLIRNSTKLPCSWSIVRPTSIWGPWFAVPYRQFFQRIAKGQYFHPGKDRTRRSFGYVGNTVHELDRLMFSNDGRIQGRTFTVSDYEPLIIRDWADCIQAILGAPPIRTAPLAVLRLLARAGDAARNVGFRNPPLSTFRLNNLLTNATYDIEPLKEVVGPLPFSAEEGVKQTVSWMRQHGYLG